MEQQFTIINNEYIKGDLQLTSKELTIWILLSQNKTVKNQCIFTLQWIANKLGQTNNSTRKINNIKDILIYLEQDNILKYYNDTVEEDSNRVQATDIGRNDLIYTTDDLVPTEYAIVYDDDIRAIMTYCNNNKVDTYGMINLYAYIMASINNNEKDENYKLCYMAIKTLTRELQLSETTILKYLKVLDEIEIIKHDYAGYGYNDNKVKNETTYFSRYKDRKLLEGRLIKIRKEKNITESTPIARDKVKKKISLKQKINILKKKEEENKITDKEREELRQLKQEYDKL